MEKNVYAGARSGFPKAVGSGWFPKNCCRLSAPPPNAGHTGFKRNDSNQGLGWIGAHKSGVLPPLPSSLFT